MNMHAQNRKQEYDQRMLVQLGLQCIPSCIWKHKGFKVWGLRISCSELKGSVLRLVDLAFQAFAFHFLGYGALVMVDDSSLAVIESWFGMMNP